ncbi:hypothetical protein D3C86_1759650 [compost metagenome]
MSGYRLTVYNDRIITPVCIATCYGKTVQFGCADITGRDNYMVGVFAIIGNAECAPYACYYVISVKIAA